MKRYHSVKIKQNESTGNEMTTTKTMLSISPDRITTLQPNQVFVFGSNTQGIHGAGAAKQARCKFGAKQGQAVGYMHSTNLSARTYAIPTKSLVAGKRSVSLESIAKDIEDFLDFAEANNDLEFLVTEIGCGLAGWKVTEIAPLFARDRTIPNNVFLPYRFATWLVEHYPDRYESEPQIVPVLWDDTDL